MRYSAVRIVVGALSLARHQASRFPGDSLGARISVLRRFSVGSLPISPSAPRVKEWQAIQDLSAISPPGEPGEGLHRTRELLAQTPGLLANYGLACLVRERKAHDAWFWRTSIIWPFLFQDLWRYMPSPYTPGWCLNSRLKISESLSKKARRYVIHWFRYVQCIMTGLGGLRKAVDRGFDYRSFTTRRLSVTWTIGRPEWSNLGIRLQRRSPWHPPYGLPDPLTSQRRHSRNRLDVPHSVWRSGLSSRLAHHGKSLYPLALPLPTGLPE